MVKALQTLPSRAVLPLKRADVTHECRGGRSHTKTIEEIDQNFRVEEENAGGLVFRNVKEEPFRIYGLMEENDCFVRLPLNIASLANDGVRELAINTAGGRIRFITNSDRIAISASMHHIGFMPHFTLCGSAGFDLYDGNRFVNSFRPPKTITNGYTSVLKFLHHGTHEVTIHFPLYSGVRILRVGLEKEATLLSPKEYENPLPIVLYGSSITQGGCASRPGNAYSNILSRELNVNHINLGFSGSAFGELSLANYISSISQSAFIYDYDCNAPNAEHLRKTHEPFFLHIRERCPDLPIVLLTKPYAWPDEDLKQRRDVILNTFLNSEKRGDRKTTFLDMASIMRIGCGFDGTVDQSHPNDLGFRCMANAIEGALEFLWK